VRYRFSSSRPILAVCGLVVVALAAASCLGPEVAEEVPVTPVVTADHRRLTVGPNLLANPGFESGTTSWSVFGSPTLVTTSHSGTQAVRSDVNNVLVQLVPVTPGQPYILKQWMRGAAGNELSRVQVNWYTSTHSFISVSWLKPRVTTEYRQYRLVATAPANAAWAEIYTASDAAGSWVYVDDVSFSTANHLRYHAYWYAESDWFGHYLQEDAVAKHTNLVYLNVSSFTGGWSELTNFRAAVIKAKEHGLQVIADLGDLFYENPGNPTAWAAGLAKYESAISGYEYVIAAHYMDEPDGAGWSSSEVQSAVASIKGRPALAAVPMMIVYIFSSAQTVPSNVDIVAVDPYPTVFTRFDFEKLAQERMGRCRTAAGTRPIFLIGKATFSSTHPTGLEQWYAELAFADPLVIGLGWFTYTSGRDGSGNSWVGARHYPELLAAHQNIASNIFGDNLVAHEGFESGATSWSPYGSGAVVDRGTNAITSNAGFESGTTGWTNFGAPTLVSSSIHGGTGAAARVDVSNGYTRQVPVTAGAQYQLRQWMRGAAHGNTARLQLNWLDSSNGLVRADVIAPQLTTAWLEYTMTVVVPAGAVKGELYVTSHHAGEWVYIDDLALLPSPDSVNSHLKAAKGDATSGYTQLIAVEAHRGYRQAQWMRALSGSATGRVQVNWYTSGFTFLSATLTSVPGLTTTWVHRAQDVTAPANAAWAEIYVSSNVAGQWVLTDDFSFTRRD
jgi:hypothetical protein